MLGVFGGGWVAVSLYVLALRSSEVEQVNDTHLHAIVQREMEALEVQEQYRQRKANPAKLPRTAEVDRGPL